MTGAPIDWTRLDEKGSGPGLRAISWLLHHVGETAIRPLLPLLAAYYAVFGGVARAASQDYLERLSRARGEAGTTGFRDRFRHFHTFAKVLLERALLWAEGPRSAAGFHVDIEGKEHMRPLLEQGRGALLLGAHLGSFDVLRVMAREVGVPVNVLLYDANAAHINALFSGLGPEHQLRLIPLDPASVTASLEVRRCLQRGEFVAILADRVRDNGRDRVATAPLLGSPASFPKGPFLLATVLGAPILLTLGLRQGRRRYRMVIEPLFAGGTPARGERDAAIQAQVNRYAARLEHYLLQTPYQWFNFYPFWGGARG